VQKETMKRNGEFKFPYVLIGIGIGAIAGLLFAYRSGEEPRKYFRDSLDYLNRQAGKLRESAERIVQKGKKLMGGRDRDSVKAKADTEAEKQAYQEERREHLGG
jgi:gas vesicle protein